MNAQDLPGYIIPCSGNWAVWLGGDDNEVSYIEQQVTVPASSPYLAFWQWIDSLDGCGYDFGDVVIDRSTVVESYDLCAERNTGGWAKKVVDLRAYAGRSVLLQIRARTDIMTISDLYVDNVSFQASSSASLTGTQKGPE